MKMGVVEARHHESVSVVDDFGIGAAQMFGQDFKRAGPQNAVAPDGHGSGRGLVVDACKQGRGNEDSIGRAGSCQVRLLPKASVWGGRATRKGDSVSQVQYTP